MPVIEALVLFEFLIGFVKEPEGRPLTIGPKTLLIVIEGAQRTNLVTEGLPPPESTPFKVRFLFI